MVSLYILLKYTPYAFYNRKIRRVWAVIITLNTVLYLKRLNSISFRGIVIRRVIIFLKDLRLIVAVKVLILYKLWKISLFKNFNIYIYI